MMEFHISRQTRDRYQFDQSLFGFNGNVVFANFHAVRMFVQKINQQRDLINYPEQAVRPGEINALGLIDEILHLIVAQYRQQKNPRAMLDALGHLDSQLGEAVVDRALMVFLSEFPPTPVYRRDMSVAEYLEGSSEGVPNRAVALEEMLLLWVTNKNPAVIPYLELFDDERLDSETGYGRIMQEMGSYFETQPPFGAEQKSLVNMLLAPAQANPYSLTAQLEFIREKWAEMLGRYLYRLLSSLDLIREEEKMSFTGPGPVQIPTYDKSLLTGAGAGGELELERFSQDREWMPRLVLIAKNSYVWLDQLRRKYQRDIYTLDQIPDEELAQLSASGFTGLWLIGLWERSKASATIKAWTGNPDAVASAYSLWGYSIAADLGGEEAYRSLRDRAWKHGIRLASDMVPNHMGIDSPWVVEHPDWFIGLEYAPFPSYTFNSGDLSSDGRVSLQIEDHYYERTDAAVVFKRTDRQSGQERYIYHGNDGTSMPWNDTAQLNYLNPEVREAVIQTILHVARMFPIIRFDAAMTLAKKHFQRLWFPEPGTGGAIPSRADFGLTREQFDGLMPEEFWREVVDRAAVEAPDTLLLAEAFWLMEGYFVRTLGMHRVYNSAFMNLLRNEENGQYRIVMKNTLEFDPEILKRYVNFMNNPDERTAIDQFGKGDKYFGICVLMATMPGLPMFGHGQIQGFSEKYGMEFRRALWDEQPDPYLIERHEREIFPLLHRRAAFAGMEHFLLYDFFTPDGGVVEDVLAYSNGIGGERNLVIYHNKFGNTRGWMRMSAGYMDKGSRQIVQRSLAEGLGTQPGEDRYTIFHDSTNGLEYIYPNDELIEKGMYFELNAYQYHVFTDIRQVEDDEYHSYRQLVGFLQGRGVPHVQDAMRELLLQPVQQPFSHIANPGYFQYLLDSRLGAARLRLPAGLLDEARVKMTALLDGIGYLTTASTDREAILTETLRELEAVLSLPVLAEHYPMPGSRLYTQAVSYLEEGLEKDPAPWVTLFGYLFLHRIGRLNGPEGAAEQALSWMDEWQFSRILAETAQALGVSEDEALKAVARVRLLVSQQDWFDRFGACPTGEILSNWLMEEPVRRFLGVNRYKNILWFNHEAFGAFLWWMMLLAVLPTSKVTPATGVELVERVLGTYEVIQRLTKAEDASGYQVEKLLEAVVEETEK